jgi:hypothetical protein
MKKIFEYKNFNQLSEQELLEMANVTYKTTGIENVVLWIGPNPEYHGKRIKVSNLPNKFTGSNCFTLTIPKFEIVGTIDETFITTKILNKIKEFVTINYQVISDYSDYLISTEDLIENLKKV